MGLDCHLTSSSHDCMDGEQYTLYGRRDETRFLTPLKRVKPEKAYQGCTHCNHVGHLKCKDIVSLVGTAI